MRLHAVAALLLTAGSAAASVPHATTGAASARHSVAGTPFSIRARTFDGRSWRQDAVVIIRGNRIESVGQGTTGTLRPLAIDGSVLTPGFIDLDASMGLLGRRDELPEALSPDLRVIDAFEPSREESEQFRRSGVTLAWLAAGDTSVLGGRGALVQPAPAGQAPHVLAFDWGACGALGSAARVPDRAPTSSAGQVAVLRQALEPERAGIPPRVRFDDSASARLAASLPRVLAVGLPETPEELDEAARARGLVLDGPWPGARSETTSLAVQALSRGDVALGSGEAPAGTTSIRHAAARLLQAGAPSDRVLACLTSVAATLAGRPERGAIEAGKVADLVLWSGDPLSLASRPLRAWVGGVLVFDDASNDGALTP